MCDDSCHHGCMRLLHVGQEQCSCDNCIGAIPSELPGTCTQGSMSRKIKLAASLLTCKAREERTQRLVQPIDVVSSTASGSTERG